MPSTIRPVDEYIHAAEKLKDWRESYYFNFVNHDHKTSGFTTIGILPNQHKSEFVTVLFHGNGQTVYYKEHQRPLSSESPNVFSDNKLTYKLIQPLKRWEISLVEQNLSLQIHWQARFPPFDFGKCSGTSWIGHFEQSGAVTGEAQLPDGKKIRIDGYSQRDKSWGQRNWHIQKWFALHAQFEKFAIGLRRDTVNGAQQSSGGLASTRRQTLASKISLETMYEKDDPANPTGALTSILFEDGTTTKLRSKLIAPKSFIKFSRTFPGGSTELFEGMATHECIETGDKGTGLIEFLSTHPKQ